MADSNRSELPVESQVLQRRATWAGTVFALATVLTCLNVMPPIDVHYEVQADVVVSETRLEQLKRMAVEDHDALQLGARGEIRLLAVKVLDRADQQSSVAANAKQEKVVLAEVTTLWNSRCTDDRHFAWLKAISQIDPARLANARIAQEVRFARWELETARHYQSQHSFLCEKERLIEPKLPADTAASAPRPTFQLASFEQPTDGNGSGRTDVDPVFSGDSDFGLQLATQIEQAKAHLAEVELAWQSELEQSSGALQIAGAPVISPRPTTLPFWMAASILILGLCTASTAGWFLLREQLVASHAESTCARTRTGERLIRLSEWAIGCWVVLAIGRLFLDALWRDVLMDSPLAALGRLLAGMP